MIDTHASSNTILVLGATGKTGRRVLCRLQARGVQVRAGTRTGNPSFDWVDRSTWKKALEGVSAVYLTYFPDVAVPSAVGDIEDFCSLASSQGVRHIVFLSGRGEVEAEHCEDIVKRSGLEWTVLRASWFSQNFSEAHFLEPVIHGHVALPVGNVAEPFVDADDIADVAVAAFTDRKHLGQVYELTGPKAITFSQAISIIARATGRDIRFESIAPEAYRAAMIAAHLPSDVADLVVHLFTTVLDGRNTPVRDGIRQALGREATSFEAYVQKTLPSAVWIGATRDVIVT